MKFARYLDNAQAPEWKRAYIDYRGLKKRIMALKSVQQGENELRLTRTVSSDSDHDTLPGGLGASNWTESSDHRKNVGGRRAADAQDGRQKHQMDARGTQVELQELKIREDDFINMTSASHDNLPVKQHPGVMILEFIPLPSKGGRPSVSQRGSQFLEKMRRRSSRFIQPPPIPIHPLTLGLLVGRMPPAQLAFIDKLDSELSKVESFFIQRVAEARTRGLRLKEQLGELKDHRRLFHDAFPGAHHNTPLPILPAHRLNASRGKKHEPQWSPSGASDFQMDERARAGNRKADAAQEFRLQRQPSSAKLPPEDYVSARKKLKRAVAEHYSGLEVLNNYRILNLTGFRKALKKFEKVTGVPLQDVYMKEKVDLCSFASDQTVQALLKETEDQFTTRFAQGDRKRALTSLRTAYSQKTHHFSTFRTGIALGLAFPALIDGIVRSTSSTFLHTGF
ncbi:SPX domain-containing protein [Lactarius indigo]|nr:SPX domain-containing protein [Lactarius indigo]